MIPRSALVEPAPTAPCGTAKTEAATTEAIPHADVEAAIEASLAELTETLDALPAAQAEASCQRLAEATARFRARLGLTSDRR
ncbi:MAG: hypothetical protein N838_31790 [Thiohalocapsa sp. PB-PSB1]|jgi:hypothetical protein|nr:MAG: hypothetical protein N838_09365 [Thiohalocapsa sp. PB-PSB1]QQO57255.1 MAG: hypothetical protein N838_31790 [Thiohalocapsa sp. PB-PSB1]